MSARKETSLPLVLKGDFLLCSDSSFLKGPLSASRVIDLKKTASSRRVIECLKRKAPVSHRSPWFISWDALKCSAPLAYGYHCCIRLDGQLYIEHPQSSGMHSYSHSLVVLLHFNQWSKWNGICSSVFVCTVVHAWPCVCVKARKEKEGRSKQKCNLSLNHTELPGGKRPSSWG